MEVAHKLKAVIEVLTSHCAAQVLVGIVHQRLEWLCLEDCPQVGVFI